MALASLKISRSVKPISYSPMTRLISIFILSFFLYASFACTASAKPVAKQQGAASAVVSESANMGKVASKDSIATKGLPSKKQAQQSAANSDDGVWSIRNILLVIGALIAFFTYKLNLIQLIWLKVFAKEKKIAESLRVIFPAACGVI